jgi:precorrin-6A synthase
VAELCGGTTLGGHNRPVRTLLVIGIGMGSPDDLTVRAIDALNQVDTFFVIDKGDAARELVDLRTEICARHIVGDNYRVVEVADASRDRTSPAYRNAVLDWHQERAVRCERAIIDELPDGGCGGFLVWGDPALYDSTIRVVETIRQRGRIELEYRVIPAISSVQALAAGHRIVLNGIGEPVLITTGRRLAQALESGAENIVVMLDGGLACGQLDPAEGWQIYWGAYLGTPDEVLVAGSLDEVIDQIRDRRATLKARKGWIMDTYLLRRSMT